MKLGEVDIVFLTYREPNKELLWKQLLSVAPYSKRVDGIQGFYKAFRRCAEIVKTDYFLMVDGDTRLLQAFNPDLWLSDLNESTVLTWASRNVINDLTYGNGCLKLWPRRAALQLTSDKGFRRLSGYFIEDVQYKRQQGIMSETAPNGTPQQAFTYGFRESFRFCIEANNCYTNIPLSARLGGNYYLLKVLSGIGSDVQNGVFANLGALYGIEYALRAEPYSIVTDYEFLESLCSAAILEGSVDKACKILMSKINAKTGLNLSWCSPEDSRSYKEKS